MYNWSVDEEEFKKKDPEKHRLWRLVRLINCGPGRGERLDKEEIKIAWPKIKDQLDPYKARLIEFLIWDNLYSLPPNITFYNWPKMKKVSTGSFS